jgi:DNA-binding Lrp family transcriptional regulator
LTVDERVQLTPPPPGGPARARLDDLDRSLAAELAVDARMTAATLAAHTGSPESTVRRRLAALFRERRLITHVSLDPERLGLTVDANLWIQLPPAHLDAAGRALAGHRAVHGALAVTGQHNLHLAVWLRDLEHLYRFITEDLAEYDISTIDTVLVGHAVKRPGKRPGGGRPGR